MLNLVLVSARTIVIRAFEESDGEIIREICGDVEMMRQVLVIDGDKVIYEASRNKGDKKPTTKFLRELIEAREVKRQLSPCELLALSRVQWRL